MWKFQHALAAVPDEKDFDTDNIPDIELILTVCAGLVVENKRGHTTRVRLVQYTAQEYLENVRER